MTTPFPFVAGAVLTAAELNAITTLPINDQAASYSLVVGDVGKRVIMNVATANTVTVDDSIFAAGDTIFIANKGAGTSTITAGAGVTINSASGLALVTSQSGQLIALSASSFLFLASDVSASAGGLVVVKAETAFSAASDTFADGVFTSDYTNYRVILRVQTSTTNDPLMKFRAAGVDTSTNYNRQRITATNTSLTTTRATGQTTAAFAQDSNGVFSTVLIEIQGVQLAEPTLYFSTQSRTQAAYNTPIIELFAGNQSDSTAFDGIKFLVATGTFAGSYTIYGYAKTV